MAKAKATLTFQSHLWYVHFHISLKNAAILNNFPLLEGFPKRLKVEDGGSYLDDPNSTSFIDTRTRHLLRPFVYMLDIFVLKNKSKKIGRHFSFEKKIENSQFTHHKHLLVPLLTTFARSFCFSFLFLTNH